MEFYNETEKIEICVDISKKLKFFENKNGTVNLLNDSYTYVPKLKKIFKEYIKGTHDQKGVLEFEEIGKQIHYHFPVSKKKKAIFKIKIKG
jgi:hypothetical protein